jgi:D-aminopeptidase
MKEVTCQGGDVVIAEEVKEEDEPVTTSITSHGVGRSSSFQPSCMIVYFHLRREDERAHRRKKERREEGDRLAKCSTYFKVLLRIGSPVTVATS